MKSSVEAQIVVAGEKVRIVRHQARGEMKGVVQLLHGFGEHADSYAAWIDRFVNDGFACVIHDQRGHGRRAWMSEQERKRNNGVVRDYALFLDDIDAIRAMIGQWYPGAPVILYGHSMGGNIALNYLIQRDQRQYQRAVLEAPWLRLRKPMPSMMNASAKVLGKVHHGIAIVNPLNFEAITRDPDAARALRDDPLYHNRMSMRLYTQILASGERAIAQAASLSIPVLLLGAGNDLIVCTNAIRELHDSAHNDRITLKVYDGAHHALHSDLARDEVYRDVLQFCEA